MLAIAGSLLLVSLSYVLLLAAPSISRHLGGLALGPEGLKSLESWLPLACGAGLVLGGASALVAVLTQITREAQKRPYISLAPVLAAFSACVLIGLRAELPLPGVSAEHVAVFGLAVAVVGGSLVQAPGMSSQLLGLACTFLPPASLFGVIWIISGNVDPARAVWGLPAAARAFLGMLTLSSFAIGAVATLGRRAEVSPDVGAMTARLPAVSRRQSAYDLEAALLADEAALTKRGLPAWVIGFTGAAALVLAFLAVRTYMERRNAAAFLEHGLPSASDARPSLAPAQEPRAAEPTVSNVAPEAPKPEVSSALAAPMPTTAAESSAKPEAERPASPAQLVLPEQEVQAQHEESAAAALAPAAAVRAVPHAPRVAKVQRHHPVRPAPKAAARKAAPEIAAKPAPEPTKPPAPAKPAPREKEDSVSLALKAARAATGSEAKPSAPARAEPKAAAPATRGDESLDELMDNVLKPQKGGKKQAANDDPIFGL